MMSGCCRKPIILPGLESHSVLVKSNHLLFSITKKLLQLGIVCMPGALSRITVLVARDDSSKFFRFIHHF